MEHIINPTDPFKLVSGHPSAPHFKTWRCGEEEGVKEGDYVTKLGMQFVWGKFHLRGSQLDAWRSQGDPVCDDVMEQGIRPDQDALNEALARSKEEREGPNRRFYDSVTHVPEWVDWERVRRGQELFVRNTAASETALMYFSLVGGFGAPKINKVLTSTGYLANKNTMKRLFETNQMIVDCMAPGSLEPLKGEGWQSCLRVRFLHARVRMRLRRSERWRQDEWGTPINQEDLIATLLSFSYNVLFCLSVMKIAYSYEEAEDYIHLWRYIGYLSGISEELNPCTSVERCKAMTESIVMHLIDPDESSVFLSHHVTKSLVDPANPVRMSLAAHYQLARMLLGEELSDQLQLPSSPFHRQAHNLFFLSCRIYSRLSYLPFIEPLLLHYNLKTLARLTSMGLQGARTSFAISHVPSDTSIDNLPALQREEEQEEAKSGKGVPKGTVARRLRLLGLSTLGRAGLILLILYVLRKWFWLFWFRRPLAH